MAYAKKLTKEDLLKAGITNITEDCRVFRGDTEVKPFTNAKGYLMLNIYALDDEGNKIKYYPHNDNKYYIYKVKTIGLHRAMWAWFYGEAREGFVIDHINNSHINIEDYYLDNLQEITPRENTTKDRKSAEPLKCNLKKPLSFYTDKLEKYLYLYTEARLNGDQDTCHKLRANISQTRARIKYYTEHIDEKK